MSLLTAIALVGFGAGWLWGCAAAIVAHRVPGPGRVQALAARSIWRDIGAGTGPLVAGVALPIVPSLWLYGVATVLLAGAALACGRDRLPTHPE
jgi:DHA1 family inner membrane transport protein